MGNLKRAAQGKRSDRVESDVTSWLNLDRWEDDGGRSLKNAALARGHYQSPCGQPQRQQESAEFICGVDDSANVRDPHTGEGADESQQVITGVRRTAPNRHAESPESPESRDR